MPSAERMVIESMLRIPHKDTGVDLNFELNTAQSTLDHNWTGRDLVPKARQEGISSYVLARYTIACLERQNTRAVVISHEAKATERLLGRVHYYLDNMKGPSPKIKNKSANMLSFEKTNSTFYVGTAGASAFGRGDTISHLHCSEIAFWPNPKELMTGIMQAVPINGGTVVIESTGNGKNNYYHKMCMRSYAGNSRYKLHFFNWQDFPEYDLPVTPAEARAIMASLDEELEERTYVEQFGLTAGQIKFRRLKLEELDFDLTKFKQEYPCTLDECFQATGSSIFQKYDYRPTSAWVRQAPHLYALEGHPRTGHIYAVGADASGGVGRDNAVAEVFCVNTGEQVAEFVSSRHGPDRFADVVMALCRSYNSAFVVPEQNNHGLVLTDHLLEGYDRALIFKHEQTEHDTIASAGYKTTSKSKPHLIGGLRTALSKGDIFIHSPFLRDELDTFIETDSGKLEAEEGGHDDSVIASACAEVGRKRCLLLFSGELNDRGPIIPIDPSRADPFSLEGILGGIRAEKAGPLPISPGLNQSLPYASETDHDLLDLIDAELDPAYVFPDTYAD